MTGYQQNRRIWAVIVGILTMTATATATALAAQSKISKPQTVEYLTHMLNKYKSELYRPGSKKTDGHSIIDKKINVSISRGSLFKVQAKTSYLGRKSRHHKNGVYIFDIKQLKSITMIKKYNYWYLRMKCKPAHYGCVRFRGVSETAILKPYRTWKKTFDKKENVLTFHYSRKKVSIETVTRIRKALMHLYKLNGGTVTKRVNEKLF